MLAGGVDTRLKCFIVPRIKYALLSLTSPAYDLYVFTDARDLVIARLYQLMEYDRLIKASTV